MSKAMILASSAKPSDAFRTEAALTMLDEPERVKLLGLVERLEDITSRVGALKVEDDKQAAEMNDLLGAATMAAKQLEEDRTRRKAPILAEGRAIDSMYAPAAGALKYIQDAARRELARHIQRKQEEAAKQLAEHEQKKLEARKKQDEAIAAKDDNLLNEATQDMIEAHRARPLEAVVTGVRSDLARTTVQFKTEARISDITKVPREFLEQACTAEPKAILRILKALAAQGAPPPAGVDFYEDPKLRTVAGVQ